MIMSVFIGAPWRCQITQCQSSPTGSHLKLQGPSWKKGTLYISHHKYWHQKPLHLELDIYFQTWIVHYFVIIQYVHRRGWIVTTLFWVGFPRQHFFPVQWISKVTQTSFPPHLVWDWWEVMKSDCRTDSSTVESTWIEKNTQEWKNLFKYIGE